MAVIYAPKQNSGLGNILGPLSLVSAFVPGLQPVTAGLNAVNSAAKGDYAGAVKSAAGLVGGGASGAANAANTASNLSNSNQTRNTGTQANNAVSQYNQLARPYQRSLGNLGSLDIYDTFYGR